MGRIRFRSFIVCMIMVLLVGCSSSKQATKESSEGYLTAVYNPSQLSLHPDYSIFHESDLYSVLYIRAYPGELKFSQTNEDAEYRAMLSFQYRLIQLDDAGQEGTIVDSASVTYKLGAEDEKRSAYFATLTIPLNSGQQYLLQQNIF